MFQLHRQAAAPVAAPVQSTTPLPAVELHDIEIGITVSFVSKFKTLTGKVWSFVVGQPAVHIRVDDGRKFTVRINAIKEILK